MISIRICIAILNARTNRRRASMHARCLRGHAPHQPLSYYAAGTVRDMGIDGEGIPRGALDISGWLSGAE